jgi:3,4-dihydroxy 2-butanone 4-phosphate synthase/GTP cyclohydrolase II
VVTTDAIPADPRDAEDDRAVARAVDALRQGLPVLVADDERRENEGDAIISAALATPHWIAWMIRHTSGYLCAPMPDAIADRLALPPMVADNRDPKGTAYTVTCDAATGVTTGISAADRCHTLNVLADSATAPDGLTRPGHVVPLRARPGGVLERAGHTEASVDLMRIAGLPEVAAIGEMVLDSGEMMRFPDLVRMGDAAGLPVLTVAQIARWRERRERPADADAVVVPVPVATGDRQEVRA